ncbi:amidase signature domain-containing protein [Mariannaea sp. PMI_226]|nr:amidase signature domain-containing protein [Mariannaea sp. PMI_226]
MATLNLVEASIDDLQAALSSRALTSVDLVAQYLRRISRYDCQSLALNSIPVLNTQVFDEAAASDDYRASGKLPRRLEGIPYTVKDSYKVKGMTVSSGSPAFKDLIANEDAFTVGAIRAEGGVLIGRTNMPPMAYGGMQRGIYGRAESPYNPNYLAAAWASGSSNGSAVSTAASMAAFGMGGETVSSGRSPASNNALVAYTPSRGYISGRGTWPLYLTCDVVVPHTRTMDDMLRVLEVITVRDQKTEGEFWRDQPFIRLDEPWAGSAIPELFQTIATSSTSLSGLRIAVPDMYIGGPAPTGASPVFTSDGVKELWGSARKQLEALGAEIVIVPDFPAVTAYENANLLPKNGPRLPNDWNWYERGPMVAHGWDSFLRANGDPNVPDLSSVDEFNLFPHRMRTEAELKHFPQSNAIHWGKLAGYAQATSIYETEHLGEAVAALEAMRKILLDDYLEQFNCDCFVFPSQGDVGAADSDVNPDAAAHAWRNGVWYSNGNRALRHLGIPSVTVPMGILGDKRMPVGLTFAGRAYDDAGLLRWAHVFEKKFRLRTAPEQTPALPSDKIDLLAGPARLGEAARVRRPILEVESCTSSKADAAGLVQVHIKGKLAFTNQDGMEDTENGAPIVRITVNGEDIAPEDVIVTGATGQDGMGRYRFEASVSTREPPKRDEREKTLAPVARDKIMVVVLARCAPDGYPTGHLCFV